MLESQKIESLQSFESIFPNGNFNSTEEKHLYIEKVLEETSPFLVKSILQRF